MRLSKIADHRYEIIAFLTGASVMILEIVGARLIAPYFGTSTYVWTAMIGVILGSLAIGYSVGGKLADQDNAKHSLAGIILLAAVFVLLIGLFQETVLSWLADLGYDLRLSAVLAAVLLFAAPSLLIGMVSPHLAKIRIISLKTSGKSVGRLEAAGALGSIAGTFLCGYFLLGAFGSRAIVIGVVVLLVITSLFADLRGLIKLRLGLFIAAGLCGIVMLSQQQPRVIADVDTSYARYQVRQLSYNGEPIVGLATDSRSLQSGVSLSNPDKLVFAYTQQFNTILERTPEAQSILVVGGGTFTFPAAAAREHPNLQVDVIEIDPALSGLSKEFFNFKPTSNLAIVNEDGRTYLNRSDKKYDIIFLDAYNSISPPFQLTTAEALQRAKERLQPGGVLVSNVIGQYAAYFDPYLQAMQNTSASVFARVRLYPAEHFDGAAGDELRNYILVAADSGDDIDRAAGGAIGVTVDSTAQVLHDDHAPIEQLIN